MHATVVMLIALSGLGCQNPEGVSAPTSPAATPPAATPPATAPPAATPPAATPPATAPPAEVGPAASGSGPISGYDYAPPAYGTFPSAVCDCVADPAGRDSLGRCLNDTFCSFIIGRSPDVPSVRQIEAAYCAGFYSR